MPDYNLGTAQGQIKITSDVAGVGSASAALGAFESSAGKATGSLNSNTSAAQKNTAAHSTAAGAVDKTASAQDKATGSSDKSTISWERQRAALNTVGNTALIAGGSIVAGFAGAVKVATDFDAKLSGIQAVSGATASQMDLIRAAALRIGKDTVFSAGEAASAIEELAKAGVPLPDILNGAADATVALAAAGGVDLTTAATVASNAMNQFGLKAKDLKGVVNDVAGAANASAIDVGQFAYSLSQSGASAHLMGLSFHDTSVAIAELGNAGIVGSDAGTSLKTMLMRLIPSTKSAYNEMHALGLANFDTAKAMKYLQDNGVKPSGDGQVALEKQIRQTIAAHLGVKTTAASVTKEYNRLTQTSGITSSAFFDQSGKLKNLGQIQEILRKSLKGMGADQKAAALNTIFGSDAIRASAILAGQGAAGYDKMNAAISKTDAAKVAATRLNNLKGSVTQLSGSAETLGIQIGSALIPALRGIIDGVTGVLNMLLTLNPTVLAVGVGVLGLTAALLLGLGIFAKMAIFINDTRVALELLKGTQIAMAVASKAQAVATGIATAAQWALNVALDANPIGIIILAIAALVAGLIWFFTQTQLGKDIFAGFVTFLTQAWQNLVSFFSQAWTNIVNFFSSGIGNVILMANPLSALVVTIVSNWSGIVAFFAGVWNAIVAGVTAFVNAVITSFNFWVATITAIVTGVMNFFTGLVNFYIGVANAIIAAVTPVVQWFTSVFGPLIQAVVNLVIAVWNLLAAATSYAFQLILATVTTIWNLIVGRITAVVNTILSTVRAVWTTLSNAITALNTAILNTITTIWNRIYSFISGIVKTIVNAAISFFTPIISRISGVMNSVLSTIQSVWNSIYSFVSGVVGRIVSTAVSVFSPIVGRIKSIIDGVSSAVHSGFDSVLSFIGGIRDRVIGFFAGAAGWLVSAGKNIIQGFINGITSMIGGITSTLGHITDLIPKSKGPEERDKVLLTENGKLIMQSLLVGLQAAQPQVMGYLNALTGAIPASVSNSISNSVQNNSSSAGGSKNFTYNNYGSPGISGEDELTTALRRSRMVVPGW